MQEIKLSLTFDETNLLMEALAGMPLGRVLNLFQKVQQQAQASLQTEEMKHGEL